MILAPAAPARLASTSSSYMDAILQTQSRCFFPMDGALPVPLRLLCPPGPAPPPPLLPLPCIHAFDWLSSRKRAGPLAHAMGLSSEHCTALHCTAPCFLLQPLRTPRAQVAARLPGRSSSWGWRRPSTRLAVTAQPGVAAPLAGQGRGGHDRGWTLIALHPRQLARWRSCAEVWRLRMPRARAQVPVLWLHVGAKMGRSHIVTPPAVELFGPARKSELP